MLYISSNKLQVKPNNFYTDITSEEFNKYVNTKLSSKQDGNYDIPVKLLIIVRDTKGGVLSYKNEICGDIIDIKDLLINHGEDTIFESDYFNLMGNIKQYVESQLKVHPMEVFPHALGYLYRDININGVKENYFMYVFDLFVSDNIHDKCTHFVPGRESKFLYNKEDFKLYKKPVESFTRMVVSKLHFVKGE